MPASDSAYELVRGALRKIGAIATGETPSADEMNDGIDSLNDLLETWSLENLLLYANANLVVTCVGGQIRYAIGPTGDWVGPRPIRINGAFCTVNGVDFSINTVGKDQYDQIAIKYQPGDIVEQLYYENDSPNGSVYLFPVPTTNIQLSLDTDRILTMITNPAQAINFPPGYYIALQHTLATMLAPDYGRPVDPVISAIAARTTANLKRANKVTRVAQFDCGLTTGQVANYQRGY